jgi:nicotinamidase-related amidase
MMKSALLVIDTQVNMFDPEMPVYNAARILDTIQDLVRRAREDDIPVIYVRNNGGPGQPDEPGTPGWEIHPSVVPQADTCVVDKFSPDAFADTSLQRELTALGVGRLILTGMQTEMCIQATTRKAVELGYAVTVVADGHTTFDFPEVTAKETIAKYNIELSTIADVRQAADIQIG